MTTPICPDDDELPTDDGGDAPGTRAVILGRRARFVAVALGAANLAACGADAKAPAEPKAVVIPPADAGAVPTATESAPAPPPPPSPAAPTAPPTPCLEVQAPPAVCLDY